MKLSKLYARARLQILHCKWYSGRAATHGWHYRNLGRFWRKKPIENKVFFKNKLFSTAFFLFSVAHGCQKINVKNKAYFLRPPAKITYFQQSPNAAESTLILMVFQIFGDYKSRQK
jgi:hypothetical protein